MNGSCPFAVRRRSPRGMPGSWSRIREGRGNRSISPNLEYAGKARSYPLHGDASCGRNKQRDPHKRDPPVPSPGNPHPVCPCHGKEIRSCRRGDPVSLYRGVAFYSFRPEVASHPANRPSATDPITIRPSGMVFPYRVRITMPMTATTTNIPSTTKNHR